jgi:hypothetical protein
MYLNAAKPLDASAARSEISTDQFSPEEATSDAKTTSFQLDARSVSLGSPIYPCLALFSFFQTGVLWDRWHAIFRISTFSSHGNLEFLMWERC